MTNYILYKVKERLYTFNKQINWEMNNNRNLITFSCFIYIFISPSLCYTNCWIIYTRQLLLPITQLALLSKDPNLKWANEYQLKWIDVFIRASTPIGIHVHFFERRHVLFLANLFLSYYNYPSDPCAKFQSALSIVGWN